MRTSNRPTLLLATWAFLLPLHSVAPQERGDRGLTQTADSLAQASLQAGPVAGMSVAVVHGSEMLLARGYGFADLENQVPATEHTVYRIGSITKQFTAAAIMQLAEQKKLRLEDDIKRYLPGYDTQGHTVTIRELLNHTSGIQSFTELPAFQARQRIDLPSDSLLAIFQHEAFDFPPATDFHYNNSAYYLLGLAEYMSMLPPFAGGNLCSTVLDLATWTHALADGHLITRASYEEMTTPGRLTDGTVLGYGYGLFVSTLAGHTEIVHTGHINGFSSHKAFYPNDSLTIVVLTNTEGPVEFPGQIARPMARRALGIPEDPPKVVPLGRRDRVRFVGVYRTGTLELTVTETEGKLRLNEPFPGVYLYQGRDVFALENTPDVRLLFSGRGSRADRLIFEFAGEQGFYLTRAQ